MNIGFAFGDHIKTEKIRRRGSYESSRFEIRGFLLLSFLLAVAVVCFGRLVYLQLVQGANYRSLSDSNRIRTQIIYSPRGIIFDRNGIPLVHNTPGFRQNIEDQKSKKQRSVFLNKEKALSLIAAGEKNISVDSLREYPYKEVMAHVLGYIGQISEDDLRKSDFLGYSQNDFVGKTGIEEEYEGLLRGKDGKELIEVDAFGDKARSLGQTDPAPGQDIILTLDSKLQQAAYLAASEIERGTVIVSKPNGEILAMVSKPSYDPNLFTLDDTYFVSSDSAYKSISSVLTDGQGQPLLNRSIGGVYPPGSTFKLVVAAAGLEDKVIDASYRVKDTGILKIGDFSFANWYYTEYGRTEEGEVDVVRGLSRSNDIFFYKLAEVIGIDRISAMAMKFGLGDTLGIDLPGEAAGLVPTRKWKKSKMGEDWYLGDTYHYGIGQGYLLTTPLQVNSWTQVIANGGVLSKPHLMKSDSTSSGRPGLRGEGNSKLKSEKILSEKTIGLIRQGMIESCSTGGVAWPLFNFRIKNSELKIDGKNFMKLASTSADVRQVSIACKTGTAEHGGEKTLPHAWITLFAPVYDPQIVVTVLSESSGEGSNKAAPVAKRILESYFSQR